MKSLDILRTILVEAQSQLCASTKRDWITIQSRYKDEGDSFLGITLPLFSEWLETSIRDGEVAPWIFSKFRRKPKRISVLPCFLHGLTVLIFDAHTGKVRSDLDSTAVLFIRQICLFHKKMFYVCKEEKLATSISSYEETDLSMRRATLPKGQTLSDLDFVGAVITNGLEESYIEKMLDHRIKPRHGPGATADRLWANAKYRDRTYYRRWHGNFSWEELYGFSTIHQTEGREVEPGDELPAKVVAVPKTMKAARIICVEPTAMQYAQQLVSTRLRAAFVELGINRQLNLTDQSRNQRLARSGSINGRWVTLDLSEASDRLHCKVVSRVFRNSRTLKRHLFACRTSKAMLPDGRILHLMKYASMGSALTFPVEAFCFYVICTAAVFRHYCDVYQSREGHSPGRSTMLYLARKAKKQVFVFGDDIIAPTTAASAVVAYLERFNLKVNSKKSFLSGPFRESCGHDYVNGEFVTPVYLRHPAPTTAADAVPLVSWVSMSNRFHISGLWQTAEYIREYLDKIKVLPLVSPFSEGLGYHHYTGAYQPMLWSKTTTSWKVRTLVASSKKEVDVLLDYDALLATQILSSESEQLNLPFGRGDSDLTRSPKRNSLRLRQKMVQPY